MSHLTKLIGISFIFIPGLLIARIFNCYAICHFTDYGGSNRQTIVYPIEAKDLEEAEAERKDALEGECYWTARKQGGYFSFIANDYCVQ